MTKKHFIAIAAILAAYRPAKQTDPFMVVPEQLVEDIADFCASLNPNFDRDRFMRACEGKK